MNNQIHCGECGHEGSDVKHAPATSDHDYLCCSCRAPKRLNAKQHAEMMGSFVDSAMTQLNEAQYLTQQDGVTRYVGKRGGNYEITTVKNEGTIVRIVVVNYNTKMVNMNNE